jgi:hypothetical protein
MSRKLAKKAAAVAASRKSPVELDHPNPLPRPPTQGSIPAPAENPNPKQPQEPALSDLTHHRMDGGDNVNNSTTKNPAASLSCTITLPAGSERQGKDSAAPTVVAVAAAVNGMSSPGLPNVAATRCLGAAQDLNDEQVRGRKPPTDPTGGASLDGSSVSSDYDHLSTLTEKPPMAQEVDVAVGFLTHLVKKRLNRASPSSLSSSVQKQTNSDESGGKGSNNGFLSRKPKPSKGEQQTVADRGGTLEKRSTSEGSDSGNGEEEEDEVGSPPPRVRSSISEGSINPTGNSSGFTSGFGGGSWPNVAPMLDEAGVDRFGKHLTLVLYEQYSDHWFPRQPWRGSAFRSLSINGKLDLCVVKAAEASGVNSRVLRSCLPAELTVWIDPGQVSYRIGEDGSVCDLFKGEIVIPPPALITPPPSPSKESLPAQQKASTTSMVLNNNCQLQTLPLSAPDGRQVAESGVMESRGNCTGSDMVSSHGPHLFRPIPKCATSAALLEAREIFEANRGRETLPGYPDSIWYSGSTTGFTSNSTAANHLHPSRSISSPSAVSSSYTKVDPLSFMASYPSNHHQQQYHPEVTTREELSKRYSTNIIHSSGSNHPILSTESFLGEYFGEDSVNTLHQHHNSLQSSTNRPAATVAYHQEQPQQRHPHQHHHHSSSNNNTNHHLAESTTTIATTSFYRHPHRNSNNSINQSPHQHLLDDDQQHIGVSEGMRGGLAGHPYQQQQYQDQQEQQQRHPHQQQHSRKPAVAACGRSADDTLTAIDLNTFDQFLCKDNLDRLVEVMGRHPLISAYGSA